VITVQTRDVDKADAILKRLFRRHKSDYELREINRQDQNEPLGRIVYLINLDPSVSTSKLSEEILAADRDNIDSVEWEQKEAQTYLYK